MLGVLHNTNVARCHKLCDIDDSMCKAFVMIGSGCDAEDTACTCELRGGAKALHLEPCCNKVSYVRGGGGSTKSPSICEVAEDSLRKAQKKHAQCEARKQKKERVDACLREEKACMRQCAKEKDYCESEIHGSRERGCHTKGPPGAHSDSDWKHVCVPCGQVQDGEACSASSTNGASSAKEDTPREWIPDSTIEKLCASAGKSGEACHEFAREVRGVTRSSTGCPCTWGSKGKGDTSCACCEPGAKK